MLKVRAMISEETIIQFACIRADGGLLYSHFCLNFLLKVFLLGIKKIIPIE